MAKNTLPVNFQDDIMNSSMGGKRRYRVINNSDGTISLEDATTYDQVGSNFGAGQMNATNEAVNAAADAGKIIDDIDTIRNVTKEGYVAGALALKQVDDSLTEQPTFIYDESGQITGYKTKVGADTVFPFKSKLTCVKIASHTGNSVGGTTFNCASIIPDYQKLTVDNFYYRITGKTKYASGGAEHFYASISYNASTGAVSCQLASASGGVGYQYSYDIYCVY